MNIGGIRLKLPTAVLAFIMLTSTCLSRAETSREDRCDLAAEIAETAMTWRQFGVAIEDLMLNGKLSNFKKQVVRVAYHVPIQEGVASKDRVIREFKAYQEGQCREQLGIK